MSLLKRHAAEAIAARIGEEIPDLLGRSKAMQDDEEEVIEFPSLRVLPRRMELVPFQEDEIETDDDAEPDFADVALASIAELEGEVELRIYCKNKGQRELLEEQVLALFLETDGAPGTLPCEAEPLVIKGRQSLHVPTVACSIDQMEWDEERVFDKKRYSFLSTQVNFPVYIARTDAARMTSIRVMLIADLNADTYLTRDASEAEVVEVQEDGSIAPSS